MSKQAQHTPTPYRIGARCEQAEDGREDKDEPDPNAKRGKRRKWVPKRV